MSKTLQIGENNYLDIAMLPVKTWGKFHFSSNPLAISLNIPSSGGGITFFCKTNQRTLHVSLIIFETVDVPTRKSKPILIWLMPVAKYLLNSRNE